jgi:hypothetical protein
MRDETLQCAVPQSSRTPSANSSFISVRASLVKLLFRHQRLGKGSVTFSTARPGRLENTAIERAPAEMCLPLTDFVRL